MVARRRFLQQTGLALAGTVAADVLAATRGERGASAAAPAILPARAQPSAQPTNRIIMFGDGVAAAHLELGRYSSQYLLGRPFAITDTALREGTMGLMTVHPFEALVTDSAAAATAMGTGVKTRNGAVGVGPDGQPVLTVMEAAKAAGKRIGLLTTTSIWDASPAGFSVHVVTRGDSQGVVDQYLALEPDVLMGGGRGFFLPREVPGGQRTDGQDMVALFRAKGYEVASTPEELRAATGPRLLGLFANADMDFELDRDPAEQPSLVEMTEAAFRVLSQDSPNGFVLFVENENPDTASHRNDIAATMRDMWAFDEAVQRALDFQRRTADTLLLIAGDHECGGLTATYAQRDFSTTASGNRFYAAGEHLERVGGISLSLEAAAVRLGSQPSAEALDLLLAEHFPGFSLDADLREAILAQRMLDLPYTRPTAHALGRMIARQTGFYWGTGGHGTDPVPIGALGVGAERFGGYYDNTDFGRTLLQLVSGGAATAARRQPGALAADR